MTNSRPSIFDNLAEISSRAREIAVQEHRGCEACGGTVGVERRHRLTCFHYDGEPGSPADINYATFCGSCWDEDDRYYRDLWDEYYSDRL